jgi:hypothetical protein
MHMAKTVHNKTQIFCLGIIFFFLKTMDWAKGRQGTKKKKKKQTVGTLCTVCNKDPFLI